ncbi:secretion system protein, partial [Micromonospora zhanjiangensis]
MATTGNRHARPGRPITGDHHARQGRPELPAGAARREPEPGQRILRPDRIRLAALLGGVAAAVLVGGWLGPVIGLVLAICLDPLLRRVESPDTRRRRAREAADLPLAADLL